MSDDDLTISYGLKELLAKFEDSIKTGFARVEKGLEDTTKQLERRMEKVEARVASLESQQRVDEAKAAGVQHVRVTNQDRLARVWAALAALAAVALAVVTVVLR